VWNVLDNEIRPAIACIITLALDPYQPITAPLVRTRDLRFLQVPRDEGAWLDRFWTIGGTISTTRSLDELSVTLIERDQVIQLQSDGRFVIGRLKEGDYTLEVVVKGRKPRRHKITVPSPDYEFEV
jgi:hypothetical protein